MRWCSVANFIDNVFSTLNSTLQRAFDCLTVPEQKANFEQFGHPDGQSPDTIDPFSLHEVMNWKSIQVIICWGTSKMWLL